MARIRTSGACLSEAGDSFPVQVELMNGYWYPRILFIYSHTLRIRSKEHLFLILTGEEMRMAARIPGLRVTAPPYIMP